MSKIYARAIVWTISTHENARKRNQIDKHTELETNKGLDVTGRKKYIMAQTNVSFFVFFCEVHFKSRPQVGQSLV